MLADQLDFLTTAIYSRLKKTLERTGLLSVGRQRVAFSREEELALITLYIEIHPRSLDELGERLLGQSQRCSWSMILAEEYVREALDVLRSTPPYFTLTETSNNSLELKIGIISPFQVLVL